MGEVIALIRVMPDGVVSDEELERIIEDIKTKVSAPASLGRIEIKPVAFGLKGLNVTVIVPDDAGGLDPVVEQIATIKKVDSVEVTDVGRT